MCRISPLPLYVSFSFHMLLNITSILKSSPLLVTRKLSSFSELPSLPKIRRSHWLYLLYLATSLPYPNPSQVEVGSSF